MYTAMSSANVMISDKMQYPGAGVYADERDGFIWWLRGEFAAANAIIDSLCSHLKSAGEGGDTFRVAEVVYALQQVKQQNRMKVGGPGKECKRSGGVGSRQGQNSTVATGILNCDEKDVRLSKYSNGLSTKLHVESKQKIVDLKTTQSGNSECEAKELDYKLCSDVHLKNDSSSTHTAHLKPNGSAVAKTFVGSEMLDGKQINAVEGMKTYEHLFDDSEVGKMVSLVNDLRISGRQQKFQG
ncbi:hypothetical protein L1987_18605 [Smallanthus sonchifolius]|uniref:Uncharacterized protein n=1 Tax=Smallanthus sonchifolius TaxID=185202 RepID=A0ACB9J0S3_9ASTR|nr:hypothetical protein L1987_18605 [Smallanthus sonchifolius]